MAQGLFRKAISEGDYEEAARVWSSGDGAIAIGGSADGATISTNVTIGGTQITVSPEAINALVVATRRRLPRPLSNLSDVPRNFVRRAEEEALLEALLVGGTSQAITALRSMGGVGKTALAVKVAHALVLHYPAAQIQIDRKGTDAAPLTAMAVMEDVIRRFEPTAQLPDDPQAVAEIYRDLLRQYRCC